MKHFKTMKFSLQYMRIHTSYNNSSITNVAVGKQKMAISYTDSWNDLGNEIPLPWKLWKIIKDEAARGEVGMKKKLTHMSSEYGKKWKTDVSKTNCNGCTL